MSDFVVQKLLPLLKDCNLVKSDCSEEEFIDMLYRVGDERLEIIKWLMSRFSATYEHDLETESLENELARKLLVLEFATPSNKLHFIRGTCPIKEQENIYNKIFRALNFVMFTKRPEQDENLLKQCSEDLPNIQYNSMKRKLVKRKKSSKHFDFNKGNANLEEARRILDNKTTFCDEKEELLGSHGLQQESIPSLTEAELTELHSTSTTLSNYYSGTTSSLSVHDPVSTELDPAVSNLYNSLNSIKFIKESVTDELGVVRKIDVRKMLEDINSIKKDSFILKFNNKIS